MELAEAKRPRKPNWTKSETYSLIESVATHHYVMLLSKLRTTECNRKKQLAWGEIVKTVCAQSDSAARLVVEVSELDTHFSPHKRKSWT